MFAGNAGYLLPALTVGARGATVALGNILPDECCELVSLFKQSKHEEAKELQLKLIEINFIVTGGMGVPALKAGMDMLGYQGGIPRRPLRPLEEDKKAVVKAALEKLGVLK